MEKLVLIKVGGKIVEEEETLRQLLNDFAAIEGYKVLVHGGGRSATKLAAQLGIESKMVNGRRITNADLLASLIHQGIVPVLAPLTHDGQGHMLNTNADTIAGEAAKALAKHFEVTLMFCFEKKGVLLDENDDESVIPEIDRIAFKGYVEQGIIQGGMIPKLENAYQAIDAGVKQVIITQASEIHQGKGTRVF